MPGCPPYVACCNRFGSASLCYVDESVTLDGPLEALAPLCEVATNPERVDPKMTEGAGASIRRYLDDRRVVEVAIFGRSLRNWQIGNPSVMGEIKRARNALRENRS